jgi:hypothetical protein
MARAVPAGTVTTFTGFGAAGLSAGFATDFDAVTGADAAGGAGVAAGADADSAAGGVSYPAVVSAAAGGSLLPQAASRASVPSAVVSSIDWFRMVEILPRTLWRSRIVADQGIVARLSWIADGGLCEKMNGP